MALLALPAFTAAPAPVSFAATSLQHGWSSPAGRKSKTGSIAKARRAVEPVRFFCPNSTQEPILKEALKEPIAFVGGIFAGLLRLDLNEEPLKEWVSRTVEASGISVEEISKGGGGEVEEMPQQIEIE